jgi:hypothetical protein
MKAQKLKPTMFFDSELNILDYCTQEEIEDFKTEKYDKALTEWKLRQEKPKEPRLPVANWVSMSESKKYAEDKKVYNEALQYYNENRLRYKGFRPCTEEYLGELAFTNDEVLVVFNIEHNTPICSEFQIIDVAVYRGENTTTEIAELICLENGIKLDKI